MSARQGAEVTLTSVFAIDKMQASRHEVEHALAEGIAIRGGWAPVKVLRDASGRATALRVIRCEAKIVGGRLEIKNIEGTEEDIEADLIVSAIGQAVDFHRPGGAQQRQGRHRRRPNYQVQGQAGMFVGGDVVRPTCSPPRSATAPSPPTASTASSPASRSTSAPKIDVHTWDMKRKLVEKGLTLSEVHEPIRGTDGSTAAIHNFDNRSDRYVIPHEELFLGHFQHTLRHKRKVVTLNAEQALNNFEERVLPLSEAEAQAEAKRCMSCGLCFECDNCVVYCPQTAVFKVPKSSRPPGAMSTPTTANASAATSARTCAPPATSRWASGVARCCEAPAMAAGVGSGGTGVPSVWAAAR